MVEPIEAIRERLKETLDEGYTAVVWPDIARLAFGLMDRAETAEAENGQLRENLGQEQDANADDLRLEGWTVAVHNDYRLNGLLHTFWLLTHPDGRYVIGEGRTDREALGKIRAVLA